MLKYLGTEDSSPQLKVTKAIQSFLFSLGDELLYIGYYDTLQSGVLNTPETSETYTFQFTTNIPCPGTPTVEYEGQVYNTIQIFSQCWLKENLNVGMMIPGSEWPTDNDTIEKNCYDNEPDSCTKYGGLYQWDEMMQYTTQQGTQGICPPGWHLPSDEEWKVLEGAVDSQYRIGDPEWDISLNYRGFDAATNLKTTSGWYQNGNGTNLYGFSGLPGGSRDLSGYFGYVGYYGYWWAATEYDSDDAWRRHRYGALSLIRNQ
ncbi:MAG: FISUMP domain-containing protein [Bacteroidota bacterium]|nr:FISUMP domain-containing protein [Bacteroidota bacterium]